MNFAKRLLMVSGAVALAGALSIMLTPKAVHAVVSALVTVVNTAANPAITQDISKAASQIVEVTCNSTLSACETVLPSGFSGGTFTVPGDKNFVITSIDFRPGVPGMGVDFIQLFQSLPLGLGPGSLLRASWIVTNATNTVLDFSTSGIVLGPGSTISVSVPGGAVSAEFHGYLTSN
jgi:hypothetical protein